MALTSRMVHVGWRELARNSVRRSSYVPVAVCEGLDRQRVIPVWRPSLSEECSRRRRKGWIRGRTVVKLRVMRQYCLARRQGVCERGQGEWVVG